MSNLLAEAGAVVEKSFGQMFVEALQKELTGELFVVFVVIALGYLLGRITIKGVSLGSSGVFIVALIAGIMLYLFGDKLGIKWTSTKIQYSDGTFSKVFAGGAILSTIKNLGLVLFVTAIGFISGPTFIKNFKKKGLSYVGIGVSVIVIGTALCVAIVLIDPGLDAATGAGILMGALTSTPGLSSAQSVFAGSDSVAAASGLAYPFGVLGVVLFVQLLPKILRKDMKTEVEKMRAALDSDKGGSVQETVVDAEGEMIVVKEKKKLFALDSYGICVFVIAAAVGLILGALTFKMGASAKFSLGATGGALIVGLLFGHFGRIGRISLEVPTTTLKPFREFGLILFLTGSGIEGGLNFLKTFQAIYLLYGVIMTLIPMIVAFFVARYVFKLELLNNLGSICGGMTSTPALGSLIHVSGTDDVAQSYAATYPISLFLLVFVPQIINFIC